MRSNLPGALSFLSRLSGMVCAVVVLLGLATAPARADDPRCDPAIQEALQNAADAARVRDRALAGGIITRPEPSAGLTCMDQAAGVTGRLGNIFSDRHDDAVPAANTVVFTPELAYPDWGAGDFLATSINNAVVPMLTSYVGSNFSGTMSSMLGATGLASNYTSMITNIVGVVDNINGQVSGFSGQINSIMSAINTVQTLARALNLPMPSPVIIGAVAALEAAQRVVDQVMGALQQAMNAAIQPLIGQVMSQIMSPATDMDCNNIATLWDNASDVSGVHAIQGDGANRGAPFMSMTALLSGALGAAGGGFMDQLQLGPNQDVLDRALRDLTDGTLSGPGKAASWKTAPNFSRTATTQEILEQMRAGQ